MRAMKIWRCDYYDPNLGACVSWHPTKPSAGRHLRKMQEARGAPAAGPEGVSQVELPTTKQGIIEWLNKNLDADNG